MIKWIKTKESGGTVSSLQKITPDKINKKCNHFSLSDLKLLKDLGFRSLTHHEQEISFKTCMPPPVFGHALTVKNL